MYKIMMTSGGGTRRVFTSGLTYYEALDLCDQLDYEWVDENGFAWTLEIEEEQTMRVWEIQNLEDGATYVRRGLRSALIAMRFHELSTGHFTWKLRSYIKEVA